MLSKLFTWAGVAALVAACNPYNPQLPDEPYRCGTDEPRCPAGYACDVRSETEQICVPDGVVIPDRPDAAPVVPDSGPFVCNDDGAIDDNNTIGTATLTPIPDIRDDYELVGLAVCPTTDVDIYQFRVDQSGKNLRVDIRFRPENGTLLLDVLNSSGLSITSGMAIGQDPDDPTLTVVQAVVMNMAADTYYAQVQATPGVQNNYGIFMLTTGP